jgi:predicted transcriptional regulator
MQIELSPELQAKLDRIASQQGRDSKCLLHEAVERLVGYDECFICQVETGLAQVDRGEGLEHEHVVACMEASSLKNSAGPDARSLDSGEYRELSL